LDIFYKRTKTKKFPSQIGDIKIMTNNLYSIIARVFSVDISEINPNSNPETIDSWDSLNAYILIDEIENEFEIKFTLDEILSIKDVNSLESLLNNKISKLNQ